MHNEIEDFIKEHGTKYGGITLFSIEGAKTLINMLAANNVPIWGLDGIFVLEKGRQPSMADSIDTSNRYKTGVSLEQVKAELFAFIQDRANIKELFFEVVFKK